MTTITPATFTKKQLLAALKEDGVTFTENIISKAKKGDGNAMVHIGVKYHDKKIYDKALGWFRLAAAENNQSAQTCIGALYNRGYGVPQNNTIALEWYLKAAIQNHNLAWGNIGYLFENGQGVPVGKYKALECYHKYGAQWDKVKRLNEQGIQLMESDQSKFIRELCLNNSIMPESLRVSKSNEKHIDKSTGQLYMEIEDLLQAAKDKRECELNDELNSLRQLQFRMEQESITKDAYIQTLEDMNWKFRTAIVYKQQEINGKSETIEQYKQQNKKLNSEIESLKEVNKKKAKQLEVRDSQVKILKNEIASLRIISSTPLETTSKRIDELEKSNQNLEKLNQNLEKLLEQERRLKDNEIKLLKQEMDVFLNEGKQTKRKLEEESQVMKCELKRLRVELGYSSSAENNSSNSAEVVNNDEQKFKKNNNNENRLDFSNIDDNNEGAIKLETV